jgi:hypothetical protein
LIFKYVFWYICLCLSDKPVYFSGLNPVNQFLRFFNIIFKFFIFLICFVQVFNLFNYIISKLYVFILLIIYHYILANLIKFIDPFNFCQNIAYHKLYPLWSVVQVEVFVKLETRRKNFIYLFYILCRIAYITEQWCFGIFFCVVDDSWLFHKQHMVNVDVFSSHIKGVSSEVVQLIDINSCLFIGNQLKFPRSHLSFFALNQFYNPNHLRLCNESIFYKFIFVNNILE